MIKYMNNLLDNILGGQWKVLFADFPFFFLLLRSIGSTYGLPSQREGYRGQSVIAYLVWNNI